MGRLFDWAEKMKYELGEEIDTNNPYIKTIPRKWTESEEKYLCELKRDKVPLKEICKILDRSEASVQVKYKRLRKKEGKYNQQHLAEKNKINSDFVNYINPLSILDLYSGKGNIAYDNFNVIKNDINSEFECDYHLDALKCIAKLYSDNKKFDLVDLDPFGSAYDCFDLAIKMAKKGLCITLGEMGHKRWKRLDYVGKVYGINNLREFTSNNLIKHIQNIGRKNKKELCVWCKKDWQNISRVWFEIKPYKETSQWETKVFDWSQYY